MSSNFRGLAIEGGGVAGITYLGNLRRWALDHKLEQFTHFAASSVGSLVASMLAMRTSLDYIEKKIASTDFKSFKDSSWNIAEDLWKLWEKYGWYEGNVLETWCANMIEEVCGNREITLAGIHAKYGTYLVITKTDMLWPYCKVISMDHKSHPTTKLYTAIRESCSIPIFFQAVPGVGPEAGHIFVDGGTILNYPIELLYKELPKAQCMGLFLVSRNETAESRPVKGYVEFLESLINTMRTMAMLRHIDDDDWKRTCKISVNVSAIDFGITDPEKQDAIKAGYAAMDNFLTTTQ